MIAPTRLRGLSEADGSWKTICISRRSGRSARRSSREMSRPSKTTLPEVSSCRRTRQRPSVDLPHPDSPTSPSVSPARTSSETPSTACTRPTSRRRTPPSLDREVLGHRDAPRAAPPRSCRELRVDRSLAPRDASPPPAGSSGRDGRAPRAPRARRLLPARREGVRAARREAAARRQRAAATAAVPGSSSGGAAAAGRCAGSSRAAPRCRDAARWRRARPSGPSSTMRPAYITQTRSATSATTPMSCVISTIAEPKSRAELADQRQDLRLDRHVERRRRLVRDQQVGVARERHRDHHALAHAARELVRVVVDAPLRLRDADGVEQLDRAAARVRLRDRLVRAAPARRSASRRGRPG